MNNISNIDIAILSKVNELARRYRLKASDAEALLSYDSAAGQAILTFPSIPGGEKKIARFKEMLNTIGCHDGILRAKNTGDIEDVLDAAIKKAPRSREI